MRSHDRSCLLVPDCPLIPPLRPGRLPLCMLSGACLPCPVVAATLMRLLPYGCWDQGSCVMHTSAAASIVSRVGGFFSAAG
jgi:hypothetical protein